MNIIKPPLLKKGDTIGILAVSGAMTDDTMLNNAIDFFQSKGYKIKLSDNIYSKYRYLAGTDKERVSALHKMFLDKEVDAIICLRGGFGALRIIDKIDYSLIRQNPKIFCGYSDITVLNAMFLKHCGLATYSGPMVLSDFGQENLCEYTINKFFETVQEGKFDYDGTFLGGNLASLVSLCGMNFVPDFKFDFFVEDLNEPVYKIDKMLTQLLNISQFRENIKSFYVGDFLGIDNQDWLEQVLNEFAQKLDIPIYMGFPASHSNKKATIPYGFYKT